MAKATNKTTKGAAQTKEYRNRYSASLLKSKNIILRGAPGTGKTHLARSIAADIVSEGMTDDYSLLTEDQKKQIEFVQFHPSYDYTDFVEGLRPVKKTEKIQEGSAIRFGLQPGIFKEFVDKVREESNKEIHTADAMIESLFLPEKSQKVFKLKQGKTTFTVAGPVDPEGRIPLSLKTAKGLEDYFVKKADLKKILESDKDFSGPGEIQVFLGRKGEERMDSYLYPLQYTLKAEQKSKDYVFIIDEINRGEISKIFGELFFSIDPGYRGEAGAVSTQYSNLHEDPEEKFFIPENVYIIGTMNDIDRSVDTFDFAMRRRFRFIEVKVDQKILNTLAPDIRKAAKKQMKDINKAILAIDDLGEDYQIGPAYFLKRNEMSSDELWTDCLEPLLQEYVRGLPNAEEHLKKFAEAYGYEKQD